MPKLQKDFVVSPMILRFMKMKVAPTFCPDCRLQRRLSFRNERTLYKRPCELCGQETISMYDPVSGIKIIVVNVGSLTGGIQWIMAKNMIFSSFFPQFSDLIKFLIEFVF